MPRESWLDKAEKYLASAELLRDAGDLDSCVSRAYYAVRYTCIYFLAREGLAVERRWQHDTVLHETIARARSRQWLRQITMAGQQDVGASILRLLTLRGDADYDQSTIKDRDAERALYFARAFYQAVKDNVP